jgi:CRISPR/Cas system-associated protein Csx1|tara:strand:- start:866 stop:1063 length:198 start_codon:yes stop_codon:yes gene_type:complete
MVGIYINAINKGEVKTPKIEKSIPIIPAIYSLFVRASIPKIKAIGLNKKDRINIPINPKIILRLP